MKHKRASTSPGALVARASALEGSLNDMDDIVLEASGSPASLALSDRSDAGVVTRDFATAAATGEESRATSRRSSFAQSLRRRLSRRTSTVDDAAAGADVHHHSHFNVDMLKSIKVRRPSRDGLAYEPPDLDRGDGGSNNPTNVSSRFATLIARSIATRKGGTRTSTTSAPNAARDSQSPAASQTHSSIAATASGRKPAKYKPNASMTLSALFSAAPNQVKHKEAFVGSQATPSITAASAPQPTVLEATNEEEDETKAIPAAGNAPDTTFTQPEPPQTHSDEKVYHDGMSRSSVMEVSTSSSVKRNSSSGQTGRNDASRESTTGGLQNDKIDNSYTGPAQSDVPVHTHGHFDEAFDDSEAAEHSPRNAYGNASCEAATEETVTHNEPDTTCTSLSPSAPQSPTVSRRRRRGVSFDENGALARESVDMDDFTIVKVLGKGCAGKVLLARKNGSNSLFAIKAIYKHHVLAHRELQHTLTEQRILRKLAVERTNPFAVRMACSFQDQDNLFLVLDFHPGGDLATQLARYTRLGKDRTRFYAAEILEGLEGLHSSGIVYRDLKPENILLAADGHVVLTDFGLSKHFVRESDRSRTAIAHSPPWLARGTRAASSPAVLSPSGSFLDQHETTMTFCGTAEYLAPEVLLGNPYSYPVDLWSLGTMIFEMLMGVTPFYNEDHSIMYRRVLHEQLDFGNDRYLDPDTRAFLRGLLQKDPEFRMTVKRAKRSKYFAAIDWDYIHQKRYIPPFVPETSLDDPEDTRNFDQAFLDMDTAFVDASDIQEAELKAKNSGKQPDPAFDEHGRDVFENYTFHPEQPYRRRYQDSEIEAILRDRSSDHSVQGCEGDAEQATNATDEDGQADEDEEEDTALSVGDESHAGHEITASGQSAETTPSGKASRASSEEQREYETGVTSASVTDDEGPKHPRDPSSPASDGGGLESVPEVSQQAGDRISRTETTLEGIAVRNSVEMPRSPADDADAIITSTSAAAKMTGGAGAGKHDLDDWHVIEGAEDHEHAPNGLLRGPRKRVMAGGPSMFAKGIVDKYKLQLKPLSRVSTPLRRASSKQAADEADSAGSPSKPSSPKPAAAVGSPAASQTSLSASPELPQPKRRRAPRLVRASTEWLSGSLSSTSPTPPRFRLRKSRKNSGIGVGVELGSGGKMSASTEPGTRASTPMTIHSSSTLPGDPSHLPIHRIARQSTQPSATDEATQQSA